VPRTPPTQTCPGLLAVHLRAARPVKSPPADPIPRNLQIGLTDWPGRLPSSIARANNPIFVSDMPSASGAAFCAVCNGSVMLAVEPPTLRLSGGSAGPGGSIATTADVSGYGPAADAGPAGHHGPVATAALSTQRAAVLSLARMPRRGHASPRMRLAVRHPC
jgi:hypothetical protein